MENEIQIFKELEKQAWKNSDPLIRARHASAIVYRKKILSFGFNQKKTHPLQGKFQKNIHANFLHAEIDAIKNYCKSGQNVNFLEKCDLFVIRVKYSNWHKTNQIIGNSCPCIGCFQAIESFGFNRVLYTIDCDYHKKYEIIERNFNAV